MRTEELDFDLPERLIARHPLSERSASRLLVARAAGPVRHLEFRDFPSQLRDGDLLVLNDTRVLPARLALRKETGGQVEGLWLAEREEGLAEALLGGSRLRPGLRLRLGTGPDRRTEGRTAPGNRIRLERRLGPGRWLLMDESGRGWSRLLEESGATALPPYIRRLRRSLGEKLDSADDRARYQTVWASAPGAVAAPTASLHLDQALLDRLRAAGVRIVHLTLHVGPGTFLPIETERVEDHPMHAERYAVPRVTCRALLEARARGARIVAAGTTVCRVLEQLGAEPGRLETCPPEGLSGQASIFLRPGHRFRFVDALLTNFHTPRSTLLALVAAFAEHLGAEDGLRRLLAVYAVAVEEEYRFFSYGDASLWLPRE